MTKAQQAEADIRQMLRTIKKVSDVAAFLYLHGTGTRVARRASHLSIAIVDGHPAEGVIRVHVSERVVAGTIALYVTADELACTWGRLLRRMQSNGTFRQRCADDKCVCRHAGQSQPKSEAMIVLDDIVPPCSSDGAADAP